MLDLCILYRCWSCVFSASTSQIRPVIVSSVVPKIIPEVSIADKRPGVQSEGQTSVPDAPEGKTKGQEVQRSPRQPPEITPRVTMTSFSNEPVKVIESTPRYIFRPAYRNSKYSLKETIFVHTSPGLVQKHKLA